MKTVLVFGDSLAWGFEPGTRARYPFHQRWPNVLQAELGEDYKVYENALNARSTVHENPFLPGRNGSQILPVLLEAHAPLNLVILALGSNDFHSNYGMSPLNIARGMRRLIQIVKDQRREPGMPLPEVLVVSPPKVVKTENPYYAGIFENTHEIHHQLAPLYQGYAEEEGAHFFDAAEVASGTPIDGIHLSVDDTMALGHALVQPVRDILEET